jgi:hypothetical protein
VPLSADNGVNAAQIMQFNEETNESKDKIEGIAHFEQGKIDISKIKTRNGQYEFGKFGSFKDFKENSMNHEQMMLMHNVSPKFKADSIDRSDYGTGTR